MQNVFVVILKLLVTPYYVIFTVGLCRKFYNKLMEFEFRIVVPMKITVFRLCILICMRKHITGNTVY